MGHQGRVRDSDGCHIPGPGSPVLSTVQEYFAVEGAGSLRSHVASQLRAEFRLHCLAAVWPWARCGTFLSSTSL